MRYRLSSSRPLSMDALMSQTAFIHRELPLIEKTLALAHYAERAGQPFMVVGGMAARLHIDPRFKAKIGTGKLISTDVDIAFQQIPEGLRLLCEPESFTGCIYAVTSTKIKAIPYASAGFAYQLPVEERYNYPVLYNACFLDAHAGAINLYPEDFAQAAVVRLSRGTSSGEKEVVVPFADPGLLLATFIHPGADKKHRLHRAKLVIASYPEDVAEIARRFTQVVERSDLGGERMFEPLKALYVSSIKLGRDELQDFFDVLADMLPVAKSVLDKCGLRFRLGDATKPTQAILSTPSAPVSLPDSHSEPLVLVTSK